MFPQREATALEGVPFAKTFQADHPHPVKPCVMATCAIGRWRHLYMLQYRKEGGVYAVPGGSYKIRGGYPLFKK